MPPSSKVLAAMVAVVAVAAPADATAQPLSPRLAGQMRAAGSASGAYVVNLTDRRVVFRWNHVTRRVLASNTKLFTTAAALARYGTEGTLGTEVLGRGRLDEAGIWRGDLYLRGGGDPTFGSGRFTRRSYGGGATVETLAKALKAAGIERVTGRVIGDESRFDSLRGGPDSGYGTSIWVGPLSALSYNRGLANEAGSAFQSSPPAFAAARLDDALEARRVPVRRAPRAGRSPGGLEVLASVESPPMARLIRLTNKPSDNFFAETLLKDLALQARGRGTTAGGARIAAAFARRLGSGARLVDGSGLSRGNRASPYRVVRLLGAMSRRDEFDSFIDSLPIAGKDGTLYDRMRRGAARWRCRGKTGTLSDVSALSGYCEARSGDTYAYSILMNGIYPTTARAIQDRMVQAIASVDG
ncbi:MAG TPA: D-alanyl-D-alanine carboxypeptidase/D-alanyl-D-alanine-endopeptidase [Thermoleophilaceae bacterium]|nr:D-alanyl-D-alanine carboxypeptidase/D-alanyl-D-alanine-endopeptidase [Thermoleophilaceae bacterium]